ncbi:translation initiation factor IF-2 [Candidatus Gottesmanbacteria bacterium]|nr:translation initiation factor IF-2 [Candidatus Gottesmanbacteria bacterium]
MAEKQQIYSVRPPIVAVLGHVNHGKTSLLDFIRKTHVAAGEHGGITQSIGAYQISLASDTGNQDIKTDQKITFIDTPGHEAFAKMRSRGANVADIAILVVAADDSVKPQTKESIDEIHAADIPMIVAVTKIDLPTAHINKVKQDLAKVGVQVEGFGGDVPMVPVSAKTGKGVSDLLDVILLVAEMKGLRGDAEAPLEAVVIETKLDRGKGMVASVVVKQGSVTVGMPLFEGATQVAKVRALFDEYGKRIAVALPGKPAEVLGFTRLPLVGAIVRSKAFLTPVAASATVQKSAVLPDFLKPIEEAEKKKLTVIIKADTAGSLEAILHALDERVTIVGSGIGDITEADVLLAKPSNAFIVGFNVKARPAVEKLAQTEKVVYRTYAIIYELLSELEEVMLGTGEVITKERELGVGQIIAEFPYEKTRIAGTKILSGRLARGDSVKVLRGDTEIARAKIKSIRRGREEVTRTDGNMECGVLFDRIVDFTLQDAIIAMSVG